MRMGYLSINIKFEFKTDGIFFFFVPKLKFSSIRGLTGKCWPFVPSPIGDNMRELLTTLDNM